MELSYDPSHNIAYLRLQEKSAQVSTQQVGEDLNVDIGPDGTVYGIELLNANEQLGKADKSLFVFVNEALGKRVEVSLPR